MADHFDTFEATSASFPPTATLTTIALITRTKISAGTRKVSAESPFAAILTREQYVHQMTVILASHAACAPSNPGYTLLISVQPLRMLLAALINLTHESTCAKLQGCSEDVINEILLRTPSLPVLTQQLKLWQLLHMLPSV